MSRPLDLIIFGATGFTGRFVVREVLKQFGVLGIKWGVAGRSNDKLRELIKNDIGENIPVIIADIGNDPAEEAASLRDMTAQCRLLISCVGPYRFYGEPVVAACVDTGTSYLDISGETEFIEKMELLYHDKAVSAGCTIISACGFDSVPNDLGAMFAASHFTGTQVTAHVESFLSIDSPQGYSIHYGTFESLINGISNRKNQQPIRKQLNEKHSTKLTLYGKKLDFPTTYKYDSRLPNEKIFLFPGTDASVVRRTQMLLTRGNPSHLSFHHGCYFIASDWMKIMKYASLGSVLGVMILFTPTRNLLLNHAEFFTGKLFSHEGPSKVQRDSTTFNLEIFADGYEKEPERFDEIPTIKHHFRIKGPDPGYLGTSLCIVTLARTFLSEEENIPRGVVTPGFAFRNTQAIPNLIQGGMKFEKV